MTSHAPDHHVIELGQLKPALLRAGRLFLETVAVPTGLLMLFLHTISLAAGLSAVLSWCVLTVAVRWIRGRHMPGTLMVCAGSLMARASIALILSSAVMYLVQPVIGSIFMALLFLGSAVAGKPITARLARDFVALPEHLLAHRGVRRMFTQIAVIWGLGRLIDAAMSMSLLRYGIDFGLLSRGLFSGLLLAVMILGCGAWGARCIRRLPGVTLRFGRVPAAAGL